MEDIGGERMFYYDSRKTYKRKNICTLSHNLYVHVNRQGKIFGEKKSFKGK